MYQTFRIGTLMTKEGIMCHSNLTQTYSTGQQDNIVFYHYRVTMNLLQRNLDVQTSNIATMIGMRSSMTTRSNALSGTPVNIVLCRLQPSTQSTVECTCGCIQVRQKIIMECAYLKNRLIWCSLLKTNFCSINFRYKFFYLKEITSELKILWSKLIKHCFRKINGFFLYHGKWNL